MADTVRCWFVDRAYNNRDLVVLTYATPDGGRIFRRELAAGAIESATVTAARDVDPDNLESVDDPGTRERYANEADRVASDHDPDDEI